MSARLKSVLVVLGVIILVAGCDNLPFFKKPQPKKQAPLAGPPPGVTVVAKVGNFYISANDLNKEVEGFNALLAAQGLSHNKIDSRDKKISYLRNEIVRKYILYQEALDRGLDKKEDIIRALENTKISLVVAELLREETEKVSVTSKEIEDFYNENKEMLRDPEQRKILEIMVPTEADAKQVYIELLKGGDFVALAKQYSKAASAVNGGDLGFITLDPDPKKRIRSDKFYEVAFAPSLEAGGISNIFKGQDGYYILKVESIKKSEIKSLSELWDNIRSWLLMEKQRKAMGDLSDRLAGETKVEIYEGKVD